MHTLVKHSFLVCPWIRQLVAACGITQQLYTETAEPRYNNAKGNYKVESNVTGPP